MIVNMQKVFFFFFLMMGVVLAVSSSSWFAAWCGLELNLLAFIPFMSVRGDVYTSESSLKYFLIQALGSAMIIFSCMSVTYMFWMQWIVVSALLLKMGAAPVHFWFPSVMSGLNWVSCMVLMSVQKVAPLILLSYVTMDSSISMIVIFSVVVGVIVGSVGGLNQVYLRKILAYSSINHMSWILVSMLLGDRHWVMYFLFYVFISSTVVYLLYKQQIFHISQMVSSGLIYLNLFIYLGLLSLGGLPPFTGFIPKWLIIQELINTSMHFVISGLLFGTIISLYFYLRLIFLSMNMSVMMTKWTKTSLFSSQKMSWYMYVMLMGLLLPALVMLF